MKDTSQNNHSSEAASENNHSGCLLHMFWSFFGNFILAVLFLVIVKRGKEWTGVDIVYWVMVGLILGARILDLQKSKIQGKTKIAIKYGILLISIAFVAWILGHCIAWYLLP